MTEASNDRPRQPVAFEYSPVLPAALILLVVLSFPGCDKSDTVTGPPPAATPTRTPTPPPAPHAHLTGRWTGTVRERGLTEDHFCPGHDQDLVVPIVESFGSVSFQLPLGSGCSGPGEAVFEGRLSGTSLTGSLRKDVSPDCVLSGSLNGTAEAYQITLDGSMRGSCNDVGIHVVLRLQPEHYLSPSTR